ncbi:MAG TPA: AAA family ATPase [Mycobacteriales bacterium]|nr:AAA family ATPase [Mycobacteriales bacterium]
MAVHDAVNGAGSIGEPVPLDVVGEATGRIAANIERVIDGKPEVVRLVIVVLLAEGHLLIEDVPGVGKTKLAKALARSIDCSVRRIQFTPDLLPSDVTGVSVYNQESRDFEFRPGAVFANLVVGDEINRASPKTQSALLECMEERQVTVDGTTYVLEAPFMVVATQNPIEMEGTYPLPEAQRDRFTARVSMGYPDPAAEMTMLAEHAGRDPLETLKPVSTATEVRALIEAVHRIHVSDAVRRYAVDLVNATRRAADLRLGASPRAALQLLRAGKAQAALSDRDYVLPDDLQRLARPVLAHRVLPTAEAQIARRSADSIVSDLLRTVPVPRSVDTPPVGRRV